MTFLALKNFWEGADIGASEARGLYADFRGASRGDGTTSTGEGDGAGDNRIILVLKGFPSFLQGKCYYN